MQFLKSAKKYRFDIIVIVLMLAFGYMYFFVYASKDRQAWYLKTKDQIQQIMKGFKDIV